MDIAEVAQRSGLRASTLRFYEEKGLITSVGRRGLRRLFDPGVVQRLALIRLARVAGFSLDEITRMFSSRSRPRIDRQMLSAKADELDETIKRLIGLRDGLRHAAACPASSHMECPKFRRILRLAASGSLPLLNAVEPASSGRRATSSPSARSGRSRSRRHDHRL